MHWTTSALAVVLAVVILCWMTERLMITYFPHPHRPWSMWGYLLHIFQRGDTCSLQKLITTSLPYASIRDYSHSMADTDPLRDCHPAEVTEFLNWKSWVKARVAAFVKEAPAQGYEEAGFKIVESILSEDGAVGALQATVGHRCNSIMKGAGKQQQWSIHPTTRPLDMMTHDDGGRIVWTRNRAATDLEDATMDTPNHSKTPDLVSTTEVLHRARTDTTCEVKTTFRLHGAEAYDGGVPAIWASFADPQYRAAGLSANLEANVGRLISQCLEYTAPLGLPAFLFSTYENTWLAKVENPGCEVLVSEPVHHSSITTADSCSVVELFLAAQIHNIEKRGAAYVTARKAGGVPQSRVQSKHERFPSLSRVRTSAPAAAGSNRGRERTARGKVTSLAQFQIGTKIKTDIFHVKVDGDDGVMRMSNGGEQSMEAVQNDQDANLILAKHHNGFLPSVLAEGIIPPNGKFIVKQFIEGKPFSYNSPDQHAKVKQIVQEIHQEGLVLGDLDEKNFVIDSNQKVWAVDLGACRKASLAERQWEAQHLELLCRLGARPVRPVEGTSHSHAKLQGSTASSRSKSLGEPSLESPRADRPVLVERNW